MKGAEKYMVHDGIDSALELFNGVVDRLGLVVSSFNRDAFPATTIPLIIDISLFIASNTRAINRSQRVEVQLENALIDLLKILQLYKMDMNKAGTALNIASGRKDFVTGRNTFKSLLKEKTFLASLTPAERGVPAPSTVWKKSFDRLVKIVS